MYNMGSTTPFEQTIHDSVMALLKMTKGSIVNRVMDHTTTIVKKQTPVDLFHFRKLANFDKSTGISEISWTRKTMLPARVSRKLEEPIMSRFVTT
mmetsp:Transcript_26555/g.64750  ORF Transcript_26555/g.64750 Transcript_26555/m.64750 type:complete len:95 (-) Transcript_26555:892-1176(-)